MQRLALTMMAMIAAAMSSAATAQPASDLQACRNSQMADDQRLKACSSALRSGQLDAPAAATVNRILGAIYHNRKDWASAERHILEAGRLDTRYRYDVIPVWDEIGKSREIIALAEPAFRSGNTSPPLLGGLLTAYWLVGQSANAEAVAKRLTDNPSTDQAMEDYRNYVLAYWALYLKRSSAALAHIRLIKNAYYRQYMRGSPKFKELYSDPEFIRLTQ